MSSCAQLGYRADGFDYSPEDINKAIQDNIQNGLSRVESNARVFYSHRFIQNERHGKSTLVMRIIVLNDRRPYGLDISIHKIDPGLIDVVEAFKQGDVFEGQDSLAKRTAQKIDQDLAKRRKNRNMFDDFRPF